MIHYNPIISGSLIVSGSVQVIGGEVSASLNYNNISNKPTLISGSSQLTASLNELYVVSGSITQTTWDNIASKPSGIVSGSEQVVGILTSLNSFSASNENTSLNQFTASNGNTSLNQFSASNENTSLNSYTSSNDTLNTTQNTRLSRIEESTASLNSYTSSLKTAIALTGSSLTVLGNFRVDGNTTTIGGNLVVQGTTTTVSASNLTVENNLIYLNDGGEGVNLDLGWAGNYNDGTYAHAGMFRDASDGVFRVFKGYVPEPSQSIDINDATFQLADFEAANLIGVIKSKNGVVSGSSQVVGILSSLNTYTGSNDTTNTLQTTRIDQLAAATASINSYTASSDTKWSILSTLTSSYSASIGQINSVTASLNSKTGSYATTGSNQFNGNQSISGSANISGSLIVTNNTISFGTTSSLYVGPAQYSGIMFPRGQILYSNTNTQNQLYLSSNAYTNADGVFAYRNSSQPALFVGLDNGTFSVGTAGNGTANGVISFSTAFSITSANVTSFAAVPTANSSPMRTDANTSYSTTFSSVSSVSVTHNLGTKNVMVMCYDSADEMFWPATIKTTSTTVVDITFTTSRSGRVVIIR